MSDNILVSKVSRKLNKKENNLSKIIKSKQEIAWSKFPRVILQKMTSNEVNALTSPKISTLANKSSSQVRINIYLFDLSPSTYLTNFYS